MTTFEIIKKLAKNRGLSVKELSQKLGFGESTIYKWKNQTPKVDHLQKVADFFNVSVDYLLGRTNKVQFDSDSPKDEYEKNLLMMFRKGEEDIPDDKKDTYRRQAIDMMDFISKTMKNLDEKNKK